MVQDIDVQDLIIAELEHYQDAKGSFGKEMAIRQRKNKNFDPAKWWLNHGTSAPNLRKLAIRILGLTCSSSACERNWSAFEQVQTKKRNKLLHDNMKDHVFVKFNSKLKQKKEDKIRDPIEKAVANVVLEDDENEWLTGIVPNAEPGHEAEQAGASSKGESAQGPATTQSKRKRGDKLQHHRKRRKIVPALEDEESASSSESKDNVDMPSLSSSDEDVANSCSSDDED
ncbi:unnamed protein product [Urochloa humidicola]